MVPVLYASQWFLTAFSCPFPVSFACRLLDATLLANGDGVMLKAALAILAECEGDLLMQEVGSGPRVGHGGGGSGEAEEWGGAGGLLAALPAGCKHWLLLIPSPPPPSLVLPLAGL